MEHKDAAPSEIWLANTNGNLGTWPYLAEEDARASLCNPDKGETVSRYVHGEIVDSLLDAAVEAVALHLPQTTKSKLQRAIDAVRGASL